ncbi:hypothetical protein XELAEV_18022059mg [Xenopus laevis]|uniref:Uncharacterized protein n=1 Tax=Xenopus laevis TaxID=8355 RepID=A0A974D3N9_XENLA|nr:hypothetical protein XELAEV_18022059mg [Xenopus laevis]
MFTSCLQRRVLEWVSSCLGSLGQCGTFSNNFMWTVCCFYAAHFNSIVLPVIIERGNGAISWMLRIYVWGYLMIILILNCDLIARVPLFLATDLGFNN